MNTPAINSTAGSGYPTASGSTRVPTQALGQNDFLKLLVTQMTSQDPTNPQKDTEFISQMAQFSSLEQSKTMQNNIAQLQANSLLGKAVRLKTDDPEPVEGTVSSIETRAGVPLLMVGSTAYTLSQVVNVSSALTPVLNPTGDQNTSK